MDKNVTISLPKKLNEKIEREIKNGVFESKNEFFQFILRRWRDLVDDDELNSEDIAAIERGKDDIKNGRFVSHEEIMKVLSSKK